MTAKTAFDLIFRQAVTASSATPVDIGVSAGRIAAIAPRLDSESREIHVDGKLVLPGFVDTHIHLDKACLLGRCGHDHGSVGDAIRAVAAMKRDFTVEDIYARGARVLERAIVHGTMRMRTHVEIDPRYYRPTEVDALCGDASKAARQLDWRPRVGFKELVRMMVDSDLKQEKAKNG